MWMALAPHLILLATACVLLLGGRLRHATRLSGPLCLAALVGAALALGGIVQPAVETTPLAASIDGAGRSSLTLDRLGIDVQWLCLALAGLWTLTSLAKQNDSEAAAEQFALLLLAIGAVMLVAVANDLMVLFLGIELMALATTFLSSLSRETAGWRESLLKQFLLTGLASALLLLAIALLYGLAGSTNLSIISRVLSASYRPSDPELAVGAGSHLAIAALVLLFGGLGVHLTLAPFHLAAADISDGVSARHAGLALTLPKIAAFAGLIRVGVATMGGVEAVGELIGLVLAAVTMVLGSVMALVQTRLRRTLAGVTVGHAGFLLIAVAVGFRNSAAPEQSLDAGTSLPGGVTSGLFYLVSFTLAVTGLFAVLAYLGGRNRQIDYTHELAGLWRTEPVATAAAVVCLLSLIGIPPLFGFWGRWLIFFSAVNVRVEAPETQLLVSHQGFVLLALVAVFHLVAIAAVSLRLIIVMVLDEPVAQPQPNGGQPALSAALAAAVMTVAMGILPGPVLGYLDRERTDAGTSAEARAAQYDRLPVAAAARSQRREDRRSGEPRQFENAP